MNAEHGAQPLHGHAEEEVHGLVCLGGQRVRGRVITEAKGEQQVQDKLIVAEVVKDQGIIQKKELKHITCRRVFIKPVLETNKQNIILSNIQLQFIVIFAHCQ